MAYLEELLPEFRKGARIRLKSWGNDTYVKLTKDGVIVSNDEKFQVLYTDEIMADSWELYQEPIDWNYVIKNRCLCWFWCEGEEGRKLAGILADYDSYNTQFGRYKGENVAITWFDHCRPVRRDELTFYEDRKDE